MKLPGFSITKLKSETGKGHGRAEAAARVVWPGLGPLGLGEEFTLHPVKWKSLKGGLPWACPLQHSMWGTTVYPYASDSFISLPSFGEKSRKNTNTW